MTEAQTLDTDNPKAMEVFDDVHGNLPREGPGNRSCTQRALTLAADTVPPDARVLDIACGPGMQTLDLATRWPSATIDAVDRHPSYVAEAKRRVAAAGFSERIEVSRANMRALPFEPLSFDLIWCEGAAYIMGVEEALLAWHPLLKRGGVFAFSEAVWLRDDPPADLLDFWTDGYPDMSDVEHCRELVVKCGYRLVGDFVLPEAAWWDDYYLPMEERIKSLVSKYGGASLSMHALNECQREIDLYRSFADFYGYVFVVARAGEPAMPVSGRPPN